VSKDICATITPELMLLAVNGDPSTAREVACHVAQSGAEVNAFT
jgi:hypothetical protein